MSDRSSYDTLCYWYEINRKKVQFTPENVAALSFGIRNRYVHYKIKKGLRFRFLKDPRVRRDLDRGRLY